jgi:hypothetical protein
MKLRANPRAVAVTLAAAAPFTLISLTGPGALAAHLPPQPLQKSPTYAGVIVNAPQSTSSVANTFVVPAITCSAADQGIIPGVGIPDDNNTNIIAAGVAESCQTGAPTYTGEADINGKVTTFKVSVQPGDKVTTTLKTDASETTGTFKLVVPGSSRPATVISFKGSGGTQLFPCGGIDSLQESESVNPIPEFPKITFTNVKIDGAPLTTSTTTRFEMVTSTGILQIKTSALNAKGTSYSNTFANNG